MCVFFFCSAYFVSPAASIPSTTAMAIRPKHFEAPRLKWIDNCANEADSTRKKTKERKEGKKNGEKLFINLSLSLAVVVVVVVEIHANHLLLKKKWKRNTDAQTHIEMENACQSEEHRAEAAVWANVAEWQPYTWSVQIKCRKWQRTRRTPTIGTHHQIAYCENDSSKTKSQRRNKREKKINCTLSKIW